MKYLKITFVVCIALMGGGCATKQISDSEAPKADEAQKAHLVRSPSFEQCELEGFISMGIARQAILFKQSKEKLIQDNGVSQLQIKIIDDLFDGMKKKTIDHHAKFGAMKFYECSDREGMAIKKNVTGAGTCFARLDLQFFAYSGKMRGIPQETTLAKLIKQYESASQEIYPRPLIEQIVPMAYRAESSDLEYESRRMIFETCLFPEEWKSWYLSTQASR